MGRPGWAAYCDEQLLGLRLHELRLSLEGTSIEKQLQRVRAELCARGIPFSPHAWLSTEWFVADGVPGIAVPFYLAHPRLAALEKSQMGVAEGASAVEARRILRHEAGHALAHAYGLRRRTEVRREFGRFSTRYPTHYTVQAHSRRFVRHLGRGYAQSHPDEDFAETFAVWLTPNIGWRRRYQQWPAKRKLDFLDELLKSEVIGHRPSVECREEVDPISVSRQTLRQYYARKRRRFGLVGDPFGKRALHRTFGHEGEVPAAAWLRTEREGLRLDLAGSTDHFRYQVDRALSRLIRSCKQQNIAVRARDLSDPRLRHRLVRLTSRFLNEGKDFSL